nr:DALR anticodon-binding domain-containing protein [Streptomyces alkaliphilus]
MLEEVGQRAAVVREKFAELTEEEIAECAAQVGVDAVGYADPSNPMVRDHVFDPDRMVSLQGDTGVHLRYAFARIRSIGRGAVERDTPEPRHPFSRLPRRLRVRLRHRGLLPDEFTRVFQPAAEIQEPHEPAAHPYGPASAFTSLHEHCPVPRADVSKAGAANRLFLCEMTDRTL